MRYSDACKPFSLFCQKFFVFFFSIDQYKREYTSKADASKYLQIITDSWQLPEKTTILLCRLQKFDWLRQSIFRAFCSIDIISHYDVSRTKLQSSQTHFPNDISLPTFLKYCTIMETSNLMQWSCSTANTKDS